MPQDPYTPVVLKTQTQKDKNQIINRILTNNTYLPGSAIRIEALNQLHKLPLHVLANIEVIIGCK